MDFRVFASCLLTSLLLWEVSPAVEKSEPVQCLSALAWQREQEFQKPPNDEAAFRRGPFARPLVGEARPLPAAFNLPVTTTVPGGESEVGLRIAAGVRALHAFADAEAERWFRDAARLDAQCAGAWLGLAIANEKLPSRATYFLEKAKTARGRTPREDRWIAAYAAFFQTAKTADLLERLDTLSRMLREAQTDKEHDRCAEIFSLRYRIIRANICRIPLADAQEVATRYDRWTHEEGGEALLFYPVLLWLKFDPAIAAKHARALGEKHGGREAWRLAAEPALALGDYEGAACFLEKALTLSAHGEDKLHLMPEEEAPRLEHAITLAWCYFHGGQGTKAISLAARWLNFPRKPAFTGLEAVDDAPDGSYLLALKSYAQLCMAVGDWETLARFTSTLPDVSKEGLLVRAHRHYWASLANTALGRRDNARLERETLGKVSDELARTPYLSRHAEVSSGFVRGAQAFSSLAEGRITPFLKDIAHVPGFVLAPWMSKAGASQAGQALVDEALREHPASKPLLNLAGTLRGDAHGRATVADTMPASAVANPWVAVAKPPDFSLPDKSGGIHQLRDFLGRPVLVIFFLGQGCAHCVEQLQKFRPHVEAYANAGISMVTIGTDSVERLSESLGLGAELNADLPYLILSDEQMTFFKAWHCYDEFLQKPLHGTFLLDASGGILWSDISHDPYSQASFLLGECQRLLKFQAQSPIGEVESTVQK